MSNDNRFPRDISILVRKSTRKGSGAISYGFPPKYDKDFPCWMDSRIADSEEKGADILMLNYIFWNDGLEAPTLRDAILSADQRIKKNSKNLVLAIEKPLTTREVVIFTLSGLFERIALVMG
jgi:hypothetical protein